MTVQQNDPGAIPEPLAGAESRASGAGAGGGPADPGAREYTVLWRVDGEYASSPRRAAEQAWDLIREPDSHASVFDVRGPDGIVEEIDLDQPECPACSGDGSRDGQTCGGCGGSGQGRRSSA